MNSEFTAITEAIKEHLRFNHIIDECYGKKAFLGQKIKPTLLVDNMAATDY